jgi:hypothetical protein
MTIDFAYDWFGNVKFSKNCQMCRYDKRRNEKKRLNTVIDLQNHPIKEYFCDPKLLSRGLVHANKAKTLPAESRQSSSS